VWTGVDQPQAQLLTLLDIPCYLQASGVRLTTKEGHPMAVNLQEKKTYVSNSAAGKPAILAQLKVWHTAFPDAKADVTSQLTEGDQVLTEVTFRGTHTGPLAGAMGTIPPTGKRTELSMAIVNWFRNGKVQRERAYFDLAGLMQQLGIAPTKS
jgi:predicted ester cyclase